MGREMNMRFWTMEVLPGRRVAVCDTSLQHCGARGYGSKASSRTLASFTSREFKPSVNQP